MTALLWITAAFMQLCAVVAYGVLGFGVAFVLLELFVVLSFGLTLLSIVWKARGFG